MVKHRPPHSTYSHSALAREDTFPPQHVVFRLRSVNSHNGKREAKSENINNNEEYLLEFPDGHTQLLNIQADNFGNVARVKAVGVPTLPEENRNTFPTVFKPSPVDLYTDAHFTVYQPPTTTPLPPPPTTNNPPSTYTPAPLYVQASQPIYAQAPIRVHTP